MSAPTTGRSTPYTPAPPWPTVLAHVHARSAAYRPSGAVDTQAADRSGRDGRRPASPRVEWRRRAAIRGVTRGAVVGHGDGGRSVHHSAQRSAEVLPPASAVRVGEPFAYEIQTSPSQRLFIQILAMNAAALGNSVIPGRASRFRQTLVQAIAMISFGLVLEAALRAAMPPGR